MAENNSSNNYEVIGPDGDGIAVRLPNGFEINTVNVKTNEEAVAKAERFYENLKAERGKDKLLYRDTLATDTNFIDQARAYYFNIDVNSEREEWFKDPVLLTEHWVNDMRWRDNNTVSMAKSLLRTGYADDEQKTRTAYLYNTWDAMPDLFETGGAGVKGLLSNVMKGAADPASYIGAGLFAVGKRFALGAVGREATKEVLKRSTASTITRQAIANGGADAGFSAGFSYLDQVDRMNVGMIDSVNYDKIFQDAAIGAVSGAGFSAGLSTVARTRPVKAVTDNETLKRVARKAVIIGQDWLTSTTSLGPETSSFLRAVGGREEAELTKLKNIKTEFENSFAPFIPEGTTYNEWINTGDNSSFVNNLFVAYNKENKKVDWLKTAEQEDGSVLIIKDQDKGLDFKPTEYDNLNKIVDDKGRTTYANMDSAEEFYTNLLNNNPKIKDQLKNIENIQTDYREKFAENTLSPADINNNPFLKTLPVHQTAYYHAFTDPQGNLLRLKETPKGQAQYDTAVQYIKTKANIGDDVRAKNIVNKIITGRLSQALADQANNPQLKKIFDDAGITDDVLQKMSTETTLEDLASLAKRGTKGAKQSVVGSKSLEAVLEKRKSLPKEIRDVLGFVDDPVARSIEATQRLGVVTRQFDFESGLVQQLIKTGQVDRLAMNTNTLNESINVTAPDGTQITTNLKQAIKDKLITDDEAFRTIIRSNDNLREQAFNKTVDDLGTGKIYNPLALLHVDKDFMQTVNQAMFGATIGDISGNPFVSNLMSLGGTINYVATFGKTVLSPATTALNYVGGFTNFLVVNGISYNPKQYARDAAYLKNTYFPIWTEILKANRRNEDLGGLTTKLINSGKYTQQQVDEVFNDFSALTEARILETDFFSETERMLRNETIVSSLSSGVYGYVGKIPLFNFTTELAKRGYASGDELFKVLSFKKRREFYTSLGYSPTEVMQRARDDVYRWMPNYRFQPKLAKAMKSVGLGNFMAHTIEITRNTKNMLVDFSKQWQEGARLWANGERAKGSKLIADASVRMGLLTATTAAAGFTYDTINDQFSGVPTSEAENAGMQALAPEFYKAGAGSLFMMSKDDKGNADVIDLSLTNPFGAFSTLLPSIIQRSDELMSGGTPLEEAYTKAVGAAFGSFISPFTSKTLGTGPLIELLANPDMSEEKFLNKLESAFLPGFAYDIGTFWGTINKTYSKEYKLGTNEERLSISESMLRYTGLRPRAFNVGASAELAYGNIGRLYSGPRTAFASSFTRNLNQKPNTVDELYLTAQFFTHINLKELQDERGRLTTDRFVNKYIEENNASFLAQQRIYGKVLAHVNYLREQPYYSGNNQRIFDEVTKRLSSANVLNKQARAAIVNSAVYSKSLPRFQPITLSAVTLNKTINNIAASSGKSRGEARSIVLELRDRLFEAEKQFRNRPLIMRNLDEDE